MAEIEGIARLFIDIKVSATEMKDWQPQRITAFFNGIAQAQRAANQLPFGEPDGTIDDGCGNFWSITCPMCKQPSMEIVRPGKAQCGNCG